MDLYRTIFNEDYMKKEWHMEYCERAGLLFLLNHISPDVSIEIGTYLGGSLGPIVHYSHKVYSFDLTHDDKLTEDFPNVDFITGDTGKTLPPLIRRLSSSRSFLEFALIDGDHTTEGVTKDIESVLDYKPLKPLYILMHDSFNPDVRLGILKAKWESNPYVYAIELDFVHGIFHERRDIYKQMWGGMALAVLLPTKRDGKLTINQSQALTFKLLLNVSAHNLNSDYEKEFNL
jgi:cephalosporin hydroxylase